MADAVVIGAGPNGLVAANLLADAGWSVEVLEAQDQPGGAVRHDRGVDPDFASDLFSAFYPLAAASPVLAGLHLEREGLRWSHAPKVLAHPLPDGRCAVLSRDLEETAASLETFAPGDGAAWKELQEVWDTLRPGILDALFTPFPRSAPAPGWRCGCGPRVDCAWPGRCCCRSGAWARRSSAARAEGSCSRATPCTRTSPRKQRAAAASAGSCPCSVRPTASPVPTGGSGALTSALVRRLAHRGGTVRCGERVTEVVVRNGRAVGVRTAGGEAVVARRAVLADVSAPALYGSLVAEQHLPGRLLADLKRFQWDFATFKVDWALNGPVPWTSPEAAQAGTVHLADGVDALTRFAAQIATGHIPDEPFALFGQMTTTDPSRSPRGTESAWAYTHVPHRVQGDAGDDKLTGCWDAREQEAMADRVEAQVERYAPGFRDLIRARRILAPPTLESLNANLHGGAINGGTTALHQQLVFRPTPGTGRPETPVPGLYLASASAHPGGGVHGAPAPTPHAPPSTRTAPAPSPASRPG